MSRHVGDGVGPTVRGCQPGRDFKNGGTCRNAGCRATPLETQAGVFRADAWAGDDPTHNAGDGSTISYKSIPDPRFSLARVSRETDRAVSRAKGPEGILPSALPQAMNMVRRADAGPAVAETHPELPAEDEGCSYPKGPLRALQTRAVEG